VRYGGAEVLAVERLSVQRGEVLAVVGPNGSGKSTLLRVLNLLEAPTEGAIRFDGKPLQARDALAERRRMASVFQQPLLALGTVADNVGMGLRFRGMAASDIAPRVDRWLERFGIAGLRERRARTLSGGEAQRVALARALVVDPDVLFLDEPFSALDPITRSQLIPELGAILRADRITTVLVTHDRAEAQALGDRVAVMLDGRIHQIDETSRVFWSPASEDVARFVGVETIVEGRVESYDAGVTVVAVPTFDGAGDVKVQVGAFARSGDRVRVAIRPEDVFLAAAGETLPANSMRNHLEGVVEAVTPSSPHVRVVVNCGFSLVVALTPRSVSEMALAPGVGVTALFKASAVHLIPVP
jgi:tungstate transport system ATP-binding protein